VLTIVKFPNKVLLKKATPIKHINQVEKILLEMKEHVENPENNAAGIALPQVGISKRGFVAGFATGVEILINPTFKVLDERKVFIPSGEGCLSIPGVSGIVPRFSKLEISYATLLGEEITREVDGIDSIIFQHEYDHLDGILFTSKTVEIPKKEEINKKQNNQTTV